MTLDSWLFVVLGFVQIWTAVQGGIVSARTMQSGRERHIHVATFILLGTLGAALVTWQARRASNTQAESQKQTSELQVEVESTQKKLDKAQESLNRSMLAQEHMRGSLETLTLLAGKIGNSSSDNMKQLVGAINKIADTSHVGALTNKELCQKTKDWVKRAREFEDQSRAKEESLDDAQWKESRAANTKEERQKVWHKYTQALVQLQLQEEAEFRNDFMAEAMYLRDEISKRLPSVPQPVGMEKVIFSGSMSGPYGGVYDAANYLEKLAIMLCSK